jgi:hypothetical protein
MLQLSEAFALGVPVVMSGSVAETFKISSRNRIGCVGKSVESMKQCVLDVHSNEREWQILRTNGIEFIQRTNSRAMVRRSWLGIMKVATEKRQDLANCDATLEFVSCFARKKQLLSDSMCPEGEERYKDAYPYVKASIEDGEFPSAWEHFETKGKAEGLVYSCGCRQLFTSGYKEGAMCPVGEETYKEVYPAVEHAIDDGSFASAWEHYETYGRDKGYFYSCFKPRSCDYDKNSRLITSEIFPHVDELCRMKFPAEIPSEVLPSVERCIGFHSAFCGSNVV